MDNTQKQLNRLIDAYCLQAEHVERLEQAILIANKAMDICRRVDKYFNSEKQWPTGTLEAIYRDAAIVVNAATNKGHHLTECDKCTRKPTCGDVFPACTGPDKDATDKGKGGTIGGDRDIGSESKEKEESDKCKSCKNEYRDFVCGQCHNYNLWEGGL